MNLIQFLEIKDDINQDHLTEIEWETGKNYQLFDEFDI